MNQGNYIKNSEVEGDVYNEKIDNITFPKNSEPLMWCREAKTDNSGVTVGRSCFVFITKKEHDNSRTKHTYANYIEVPDFDYEFKDLSEDSQWILPEIPLKE